MKIVLTSYSYAPSVGGIETVSQLVARGLRELGHEVLVLTETRASEKNPQVLRKPGFLATLRVLRGADVVLQSNIGLRRLWLALLLRRPVVVVSHTWLRRPDGSRGWQDRLKSWAIRRVRISAAVSNALARHIGDGCRVLRNPYDSELFRARALEGLAERNGLAFLGRLVSDKGCDLAIAAIAALRDEGCNITLTIIGTGPEEPQLRQQAAALGLESLVRFKGALRAQALVEELSVHRVLLASSRWEEPFGLVALEALAVGLIPVVPNRGGLPEAVGEFGCLYEYGNIASMLAALRLALAMPSIEHGMFSKLQAHLSLHQPDHVVAAYEALLQEAIQCGQERKS